MSNLGYSETNRTPDADIQLYFKSRIDNDGSIFNDGEASYSVTVLKSTKVPVGSIISSNDVATHGGIGKGQGQARRWMIDHLRENFIDCETFKRDY